MRTYVFNISLEQDDDGWRAFYAPFEHIGASTWGKTQEAALQHIQEAPSMIVEEFVDDGKTIPTTAGLTVTEGAAVVITQ